MIKKYFKEIIILLLLVLAIALVLGVFLYDYIPTSKIVPVIEQYEVPESIQNELKENVNDLENETIVTYQIDEKDLNNYEKEKDYQKGKINPFAGYSEETDVTENSNNNAEQATNGTSTNNSVTTKTNTTGTSGLK